MYHFDLQLHYWILLTALVAAFGAGAGTIFALLAFRKISRLEITFFKNNHNDQEK